MKLLTSEYDYTTEAAQVELEHKGKIYKGSAHYKPSEKDFPNRFFGQRLAEKRAMIGYWKEQRDKNRIKKQALESFKKDLQASIKNPFVPDCIDEIFGKLDQHIKYYDKEMMDCKKAIEAQKDDIKKDIKLREQLMKKVNNK